MELTREQAIDLSIELWTWLAKTGKGKEEWQGWKQYGDMEHNCFLCKYSTECEVCPYLEKFGYDCMGENKGEKLVKETNYEKWCMFPAPKTRKKYASLFLEELKQLKES